MNMNKTPVLFAALALSAAAPSSVNAQTVTWTAASSPVQSTLAGGPGLSPRAPIPTQPTARREASEFRSSTRQPQSIR